ncbi:hypothetical protein NQ317_018137 [Molorchus minor]|uniref:Uncharacterized protein n=1 Tax=Molorchus minor TaxID=1323400 RepID=A0ABQ9IYY0_9CUCU|nr:hypothetical protein NQ317_018137 [Molorchus minor]
MGQCQAFSRLRFAVFGWSDILTFIRRSGRLSERVGRVNRCLNAASAVGVKSTPSNLDDLDGPSAFPNDTVEYEYEESNSGN